MAILAASNPAHRAIFHDNWKGKLMAVARRSSRSMARWIGLLLAALLLVGAVSASAQGDGGTLKVGMNAPVKLDPALNSNDPETAFNRALYDFLIDVKPDASLAPDLADSWTVSDDSLTYTFKLHPGVTFHDGSTLTSKDVAFSFNRLVTAGSPAVGLLGDFKVTTPDDSTVVFTLPSVNADFLYGIGSRWAFIIKDGQDAPNVLADGTDNPYASFNGTGPFILKDFSPEDHATFVRNDKYWKTGEPKLAELDFIYIGDPVAQVDALASGTVDLKLKVPNTPTSPN
jgi:peptide/nickel transport system substrate-binding protein